MRAQADAMKTRRVQSRLRRAESFALAALLIAALAPISPAKADNHMPWDQPGSAWSGSIQTSIHRKVVFGDMTYLLDASATYSQITPLGSTADGGYSAHVQTSGTDRTDGKCGSPPDTGTYWQSINLTANVAAADYPALTLLTDDAGKTLFTPRFLAMPEGAYSWSSSCDGTSGTGMTQIDSGVLTFGLRYADRIDAESPLPDTDPDPLRLVGQRTWTIGDWPHEPDFEPEEYTFTVTYDLRLLTEECASAVFSSYDAFRARLEGYDEPRLHFSVATDWCLRDDNSVSVQNVSPVNATLESPLEFAIEAGVRELFTLHDLWKKPTHTVSDDGGVVTSSGNWKHCFGIPLIGGKIKWVKRTPKAFRYAADLLRRVDGKFEDVAGTLAKAMDKAADALEWAIKKGTRAAKWAARQAIEVFGDLVYALGYKVQLKVFLLTVGTVADYSSSAPWAKNYIKDLVDETVSGLIPKPDILGRFLSDELVCYSGWKPQIRQTLGTPGAINGEFVDRDGDYEHWIVERHEGAF